VNGIDNFEQKFEETRQGLGLFGCSPSIARRYGHYVPLLTQIERLKKQIDRMTRVKDDFLRQEQERKEQEQSRPAPPPAAAAPKRR
jgi:hypothetical protein